MVAQHLLRDVVRPCSGYEQLTQKMRKTGLNTKSSQNVIPAKGLIRQFPSIAIRLSKTAGENAT